VCGVAGYFGDSDRAAGFLNNANRCMQHRGPDGSDYFETSWAGLSHVRLALFAPGEEGRQPHVGSRYVLSFNGEIYNWPELAEELTEFGYLQLSNSDTETLANSIDHWGVENTLGKLRGIFAFAVLDTLEKTLYLVRDASGTKPLYTFDSNQIYFASEIKTFRQLGLELDDQGVSEYLSHQNFYGQRTLFKNVEIIIPGSIYKYKLGQKVPEIKIWDQGFFRSDREISKESAIDELDFLLKRAVQRNLEADFPVGGFLSGGIDSSTLAILINENRKNINFFTLGFDNSRASFLEQNFDEREAASDFARIFGLTHHISEVGPGAMESVFDELCWAIEEPRVGQSYPNLFAAKLAKKTVKASISGAGGDELFGGYPWRYKDTIQMQRLGKREQLNSYAKTWHRLGSYNEISKLLRTSEVEHTKKTELNIQRILQQNSQNSHFYTLEDLLYFEYKTFLHGLLVVEDKISMSQGLEVRVPFLDQDLVHFAQNLPNALRISTYENGSNIVNENNLASIPSKHTNGKILLRYLSEKKKNPLTQLPKKGFSGPDASWFREQSLDFVKGRLLEPGANIWQILDYKTGKNLVDSHLEAKENRRLLVWSLLSLESVIRQFL